MTLTGNLYAGEAATYTASIANAGPSPAGNIVLSDSLPPGTGFMSASGTGFVCNDSLPLSRRSRGPCWLAKQLR